MTHSSIFAQGDTRRITVRGRSLADLHESHGPFNVLLIDLEGSELEVLRASSKLLREYRMVIIELHNEQLGAEGLEECRRILRSVGLQRSAAIQSVEAWTRPQQTEPAGEPYETPKATDSLRARKLKRQAFRVGSAA